MGLTQLGQMSATKVVSIGLFLYHFGRFYYIGLCYNVFKLSVGDVIVSQKGSNGEGK